MTYNVWRTIVVLMVFWSILTSELVFFTKIRLRFEISRFVSAHSAYGAFGVTWSVLSDRRKPRNRNGAEFLHWITVKSFCGKIMSSFSCWGTPDRLFVGFAISTSLAAHLLDRQWLVAGESNAAITTLTFCNCTVAATTDALDHSQLAAFSLRQAKLAQGWKSLGLSVNLNIGWSKNSFPTCSNGFQ